MILSCGEALIDMLPRTSTEGEACFAPHAGGAVFNTAIALGRLGAPSAFLSGVSSDMLGEILADTLAASKVDTRFLVRSDRPPNCSRFWTSGCAPLCEPAAPQSSMVW